MKIITASAWVWLTLCRMIPGSLEIASYNSAVMTTRSGMEAEAITRLTESVEPRAIRAILVQCLAGELAPSTAISLMLETGGAATVRPAIDDVTHRAATISRASDMLVHDRVDELTQVFVEMMSGAGLSESARNPRRENEATPPFPPQSASPGEA